MKVQSYAPCWTSLKADCVRLLGTFSIWSMIKALLTIRAFRPVAMMRLCQATHSSTGLPHLLCPLFKVLHHCATYRAGLDLSWRTMIGPGFKIEHGWSLVVSQGTSIGGNVTLFQGVTLGERERVDSHGNRVSAYPVIEDEVWIGPNAVIVGGDKVGRGSTIAGGAFVTMNIPPFPVVIGNPARVMMTTDHSHAPNPDSM